MNLARAFIVGTLAVVALYLVVTNPKGDEVVLGSSFKGGSSFIRALQGR